MLTLKPSDFRPAKKTKSISTTRTKTKSIDPLTKNKSFSARTQNQVNFDHAKKQFNVDP